MKSEEMSTLSESLMGSSLALLENRVSTHRLGLTLTSSASRNNFASATPRIARELPRNS